YIAGRQQPDKGIDLIDTAAPRVKVALISKPAELQDLERSVETDLRTLNALKRGQETGGIADPELMKEIDERIAATRDKAKALTERWLKERVAAHKVIAIRTKLNELAARAAGETVEAAGSPGRKPGGNAKQE